nr:hypothetical protein [Tanacetum cinerariifolium]
MTNLRNEITRFQQRFDESFSEAWDRFNDLLRACPHHGFSELHQLDTFYNALNVNDQDSLNSAVDVAELNDMVRALLLDKKNQYSAQTSSPSPAPIKAVEPNCVTCGATNYGQGNTGFRPQMVANQIRLPGFLPVQNTQNNFNRGNNFNQNRGGNFNQSNFNQSQLNRPQVNQPLAYQALAYQAPVSQTQGVSQNDFERYIKANDAVLRNIQNQVQSTQNQCQRSGTLPGNTVTNPKENLKGITTRSGVAYQGPTTPTPSKVAKQRTEVTKDQAKTLNPQNRTEFKPVGIAKDVKVKVDRTESKPVGIAKDVKVKVGMFHFPADFVVVDFEPDPRVPLILRRNEAITYNLDQTFRYSANYDQMTANKIDVADEACEEYSQEVLGFSDVTTSGSPTPSDDPIVSTTSPTLTPFGDSDFLLFEEADAFLGLEDDPDSPEFDPSYYDPEGDILSLKAILNSDPSPPLPNHKQSAPSFKEELKACEAKTIKSSIDEPPEVELKDLPSHLEYTFLEGDNKLPIIIAKALRDEEKSALIKVASDDLRGVLFVILDICSLKRERVASVATNARQSKGKLHGIFSTTSFTPQESSGTKSEKHDTSSRSRSDTHAEDGDIKPVNDKEPRPEVQLTAKHNILANEQHHSVQSKPSYETYLLEKVDSNINPD